MKPDPVTRRTKKPAARKAKGGKERYLAEVRVLRQANKFEEAASLGSEALQSFPGSLALWEEYAKAVTKLNKWLAAMEGFDVLLACQAEPGKRDVALLKLAGFCVGMGRPGEAASRLTRELSLRPAPLVLRQRLAELALLEPGAADPAPWLALAASPGLCSAPPALRVTIVAQCVAVLRLAGRMDEARQLFAAHYRQDDPIWSETLGDGYGRVIVFHNGRSRLEFHTKLFDPSSGDLVDAIRLAITFDTKGLTWSKPPFAFKSLSRKATDFLSVRKRSAADCHQDLSREDFLCAAAPIAASYPDSIAVGQSLGAYCALYYAAALPSCRVLATAPCNPWNPKYGKEGKSAKHEDFQHEHDMPFDPAVRASIVYDPKDPMDGPYVETSLRVSFPNAKFIPYPRCGHKITVYLRDVGLLKPVTLGFWEGLPFPEFNRSIRGKSAEYWLNLAKKNYRAGRHNRARALALHARELSGDGNGIGRFLAMIGPPALPPPAAVPAVSIPPLINGVD